MAARSTVTSKGAVTFGDNVKRLLRMKVLVGIPDTTAERQPEPGEKGTPPSNATLGYLNEFGDDERHIPARPFLVPGIRSAQGQIIARLRKAGENAFDRDFSKVTAEFVKAGTIAVSSVQQRITDGPFAPLSEHTIEARAARGRRGAKQYLKLLGQGTPKEVLDTLGDQALVKPLIDTGALRRSITYIVKDGNI
jgi:hypothetical protein